MARALEGVSKAVSVFGSARSKAGSRYYQQAHDVCKMLAEQGYAIITGGGPGIMEAANRGAKAGGGLSIGLNIVLPEEQQANAFLDAQYRCNYFFVRKMMFAKYAQAFLIFPGGYGTMDELFESVTLRQTGKLKDFPVILYGTEYWSPMVKWMRETMHASGCINDADLRLLAITDDPECVGRWLEEASTGHCHMDGGL